MAIEIKAPTFPESVADGTVATWHKKPGDAVKRDELIVDIETDKVVIEVLAEADGVLAQIVKNEGDTVLSNEVLGTLSEGGAAARHLLLRPKPLRLPLLLRPLLLATTKSSRRLRARSLKKTVSIQTASLAPAKVVASLKKTWLQLLKPRRMPQQQLLQSPLRLPPLLQCWLPVTALRSVCR